jgi:glycosyltransferase involved in cell wall biosynthesis
LIYPSIIESFGLPLIESIEFNCKIIASDLDYVKEIVNPSIIFNPFSVLSISNSIDFALENNDIKESEIIINNKIDKFTELILS